MDVGEPKTRGRSHPIRDPNSAPAPGGLTHFDAQGQAHMVDVAAKPATHRIAVAEGRIRMLPATLQVIAGGSAKKGDVIGIARIAAIQAAKRTAELIPLCHPLPITRVAVDFEIDRAASLVTGIRHLQPVTPDADLTQRAFAGRQHYQQRCHCGRVQQQIVALPAGLQLGHDRQQALGQKAPGGGLDDHPAAITAKPQRIHPGLF